jgi:hypothetical protein
MYDYKSKYAINHSSNKTVKKSSPLYGRGGRGGKGEAGGEMGWSRNAFSFWLNTAGSSNIRK